MSLFHDMPPAIAERMRALEEIDFRDRQDGTPRMQRLRQVPPETGRFLALLAASAPPGLLLEIGTSAGYSSLWLALACLESRRKLVTFEVLPEKAKLAAETFRLAGVEHVVELVEGDARSLARAYGDIAFCFLDAEKEVYMDCYEAVLPQLVPGALFVADNVLSHEDELQPFVDHVLRDRASMRS